LKREYLERKKIHNDEPLWEVVKKILRNHERLKKKYEDTNGQLDYKIYLEDERI
jgi:hypothetical protein